MGKTWMIVGGLVLAVIIGFGIYGYSKVSKPSGSEVSPSPTSLSQNQTYFSQDAKVMYFYSDLCHWCQKEEAEILPGLGDQGYKLKPMNVGNDPNLSVQYKIEGTPTFIAANGDRLTGYQDYEALKTWLDQHK